jgi:hypothetical protein
MNYLNAPTADARPLLDRIGDLETGRERLRALGRLTPWTAQQIAAELRELRSQLGAERQVGK